jgi:acyl phosphate:glycerol-3-phosphate acyltransferase
MIAAAVLLCAGSYVFGSVPFGVLVGRAFYGVDPRTVGSGNIGTANAMRAFGRTGAVLVLIGDAAKGAVPTFVAAHWFGAPWIVAAIGLAAVIGHNWSVFLRFAGGKGVATTLGVLSVLSLPAAMMFGAVWLAAAAIARYSSVASILGNAVVPIVLLVLQSPMPYVLYAIIALALVVWRHEPNIRRLLAGTELKIGIKNRS